MPVDSMDIVEGSAAETTSFGSGVTQSYTPVASVDTPGSAPPQSAGAAATAAPLSEQAPNDTSAVDLMESDPPCRHVRCGMARWISSTGRVTTQCWAHNVATYFHNITYGGTQLLNLYDESCYLEIDNRLSEAIEDLIAKRAELRRRWSQRQQ